MFLVQTKQKAETPLTLMADVLFFPAFYYLSKESNVAEDEDVDDDLDKHVICGTGALI